MRRTRQFDYAVVKKIEHHWSMYENLILIEFNDGRAMQVNAHGDEATLTITEIEQVHKPVEWIDEDGRHCVRGEDLE